MSTSYEWTHEVTDPVLYEADPCPRCGFDNNGSDVCPQCEDEYAATLPCPLCDVVGEHAPDCEVLS